MTGDIALWVQGLPTTHKALGSGCEDSSVGRSTFFAEKTKGQIHDGKLLLKSTEVIAIQDGKEIDYLPNNFEVYLVSDEKLVGSTFDSENVCGVFVMERKSK